MPRGAQRVRWSTREYRRGRLIADLMSAAACGQIAGAVSDQEFVDLAPVLLQSAAAPLGWWALRETALAATADGQALQNAYRASTVRAALAGVELEELSRQANAAEIDVVLGKGWSNARAYPLPGLRPYSDFDLYTTPRDHQRLRALVSQRSPGCLFAVDVHRGMSYLDDRPVESILQRTVRLPLGSTTVRVFGAEDQLRLTCLHALAEGLIHPTWLSDVAFLVAGVAPDFDWDYFGAGSPRRGEWCRAAIATANELLGVDLSRLPQNARHAALPRWLLRSVLVTWGRGRRSRGSRTPISRVSRSSKGIVDALIERWPLPIEATVGVGGRVNALPRLPYQIAESLRRSTAYVRLRWPSPGRALPRAIARPGLPGRPATPSAGRGEPRIAILVLGCLLTRYERCIATIRSTWGTTPTAAMDIYYVYGGQGVNAASDLVPIEELIGQPRPDLNDDEVWVSGDIILCGAADLYADQQDCVLRKRLIAFGYLAGQLGYDFIYTVCASSYVDVAALRRYVRGVPDRGVYHGPLGIRPGSDIPFVSGSSMLLSGDMAMDLARHAETIVAQNRAVEPDDVAIGRWFAEHHCDESMTDICAHIAVGERATSNQAFVLPFGRGIIDYVMTPPRDQVPQPQTYHYHFPAHAISQMADFHRRYFVTSGGPLSAAGLSSNAADTRHHG